MSKALIGIDIGNAEISMAVSRGAGVKFASERLPENMVRNDHIASPELLARFLRDVRKKYRLPSRQAAVILPEYSTYFRHMTVPAMPAEQLQLNLPYEFRDYISTDNIEYNYDYAVIQTIDGENGEPESIEIIAAAAQKKVVQQYAELMHRAGMKLRVALPREAALINLMKSYVAAKPDEASRETCIVDVGFEHTRVYIFVGDNLKASKVIDVGCQQLDNAIAAQYNIDPYLAATYRETNHEDILDGEACRGIYDAIALEIRKTINFYFYDERQSELNDIFFSGVGSGIASLRENIISAVSFTEHPISELLPAAEKSGTELPRTIMAIGVAL